MYVMHEDDKEYRFGNSGPKYLMKGPRMNFALVQFNPGEDFPAHYHNVMEENFYILEVDQTIDSYRIALFKDHLALLDRLLGKECRGTLTCDYVEIDRMKMKDLKKSLLWRTK